jgi:hypothetical protein
MIIVGMHVSVQRERLMMLVEGVVVALAMLWVLVLFWWSLTPCTLQDPAVSDHNHEYASPEYVVRLLASATLCALLLTLCYLAVCVAPVRVCCC